MPEQVSAQPANEVIGERGTSVGSSLKNTGAKPAAHRLPTACHSLLINQFLSPLTNKRQDAFGGSREDRCRFLIEIVTGIKRQEGSGFPVMVRLVAEDTMEEGCWFAHRLEQVGADAIHPDFGLGGKEVRLEPMPYSQAWRVYLAKKIKEAVSIPVIAVGVIREPWVAERILAEEEADFVALRGLVHSLKRYYNLV